MHNYRYYTIEGVKFYAPSVDFAFGLARARFPFRTQWTCSGSHA